MLKGLMGATIWSEDLNNLLPFYRDVLGLKVAYEVPGFVGFGERADGGGYVGAYLGLGTHSEVKGKPSDPYRYMIGLESDDVDADFERLTAAGVEFMERGRPAAVTFARGLSACGRAYKRSFGYSSRKERCT